MEKPMDAPMRKTVLTVTAAALLSAAVTAAAVKPETAIH
jgi:hypothetical protein